MHYVKNHRSYTFRIFLAEFCNRRHVCYILHIDWDCDQEEGWQLACFKSLSRFYDYTKKSQQPLITLRHLEWTLPHINIYLCPYNLSNSLSAQEWVLQQAWRATKTQQACRESCKTWAVVERCSGSHKDLWHPNVLNFSRTVLQWPDGLQSQRWWSTML